MKKQYSTAFKAKLVLELLRENKSLSQLAAEHQVHPNQLRQWRDQVIRDLPTLCDKRQQSSELLIAYEQQAEELYAEIGRLTTQVAWLKKNLVSTLSRTERLKLVEREGCELALTLHAELLGLNRTSLYYQVVEPTAAEVRIKHRIDEIYTASPFYGSRRITAVLQREGQVINRKTVQRHMREIGLAGICPGPNLSRRNQEHRVFPYLLRGLEIICPNHVWGIDITYIRLVAGWLYLVAVLDWYSRYVLSWELDQSLELPFVMEAVERALSMAQPMIWNSDQGSHFTSDEYVERLQQAEVQISMDSKGRALDNIFTERLWRSVKYEEVYLHEYQSPRDARHGLARYLNFYNQERPHQALDYRTPAEVYFGASVEKEQMATTTIMKGANPTLNTVTFLS